MVKIILGFLCLCLISTTSFALESMPMVENFKISHSTNPNLPQIGLIHNVLIEHKDSKGKILGTYEYKNLITSAGKAGVASRINGSGGEAVFSYVAIGTDSTAAVIGNTILGAEITTNGGQRALASLSRVTTTVANDTAQLVILYNFTASFAVTEAGIFNNATAGLGTLLARRVFGAINVVNGDSITITWQIQVA